MSENTIPTEPKYIMRSDLEPFLAEDGSLDMEKLGLRDAVEENQSGALNVMHRVANFVSRRDNKDDDKTEETE